MPSILLVRFVTVKTILCGMRSPSSMVTPSSIQRRPGCSGSHAFVMFEPFENFAASKAGNAGFAGSPDGLGSVLGEADGPVSGSVGVAAGNGSIAAWLVSGLADGAAGTAVQPTTSRQDTRRAPRAPATDRYMRDPSTPHAGPPAGRSTLVLRGHRAMSPPRHVVRGRTTSSGR